MTYYAPTLFEVSLGMSQERALFFGCWVQVWYLIASFVTVSCLLHTSRQVDIPTSTVVHDRPCRPTQAMDQHGSWPDGGPRSRGGLRCSGQHKLEYRCCVLRLPVRDMFYVGYVPQTMVGPSLSLNMVAGQGGWLLCGCTLQRSYLSRSARRGLHSPLHRTSWGTSLLVKLYIPNRIKIY